MPFAFRTAVAVLALLVLLGDAAWTAAPARSAQPRGQRVVAIGDVHGSFDGLTAILQAAQLIDAQRRWIGGRTRLVQTGDILDRGAGVRDVMDLFMRLEDEARRAGGRVDVLFGNHEGMNVLRDPRDVGAEAFESFADKESESRRVRAFSTHATIARRAGQELNRGDWLREHPPGFLEYLEATGPSGRYGRWLRARKPVAKIDDSIFMHAGISVTSAATVDEVNRTIEREIRMFDAAVSTLQEADLIGPAATLQDVVTAAAGALNTVAVMLRDKQDLPKEVTQDYVTRLQGLLSINQWWLTTPEGPLWYRGYATLGDDAQPQIEAMLKRLGVRRMVTGHTPQLPGAIRARFGGGVFLIDTGMLSTYYKGGRPSALEIAGGQVTAIYTDSREVLTK
jgi:hypothetical protein